MRRLRVRGRQCSAVQCSTANMHLTLFGSGCLPGLAGSSPRISDHLSSVAVPSLARLCCAALCLVRRRKAARESRHTARTHARTHARAHTHAHARTRTHTHSLSAVERPQTARTHARRCGSVRRPLTDEPPCAVVAPKQAPFRPRPVEHTTQRHTKAHTQPAARTVSQTRRGGGRAAVGSGSGRQSRRGPEGSAAAEMGSRDGTPAQAGDFGAGEVLGALCDLVEIDLCAAQHTAHNMHRATCNMQHADTFVRRATCTAPHSTQLTTRNMQPHMRSQAVAPPKSTTPVIPAADYAHARTHARAAAAASGCSSGDGAASRDCRAHVHRGQGTHSSKQSTCGP